MPRIDEINGIRTDCYFFRVIRKEPVCMALVNFYNEDKEDTGLCDRCPFFKTPREFMKGWANRCIYKEEGAAIWA